MCQFEKCIFTQIECNKPCHYVQKVLTRTLFAPGWQCWAARRGSRLTQQSQWRYPTAWKRPYRGHLQCLYIVRGILKVNLYKMWPNTHLAYTELMRTAGYFILLYCSPTRFNIYFCVCQILSKPASMSCSVLPSKLRARLTVTLTTHICHTR